MGASTENQCAVVAVPSTAFASKRAVAPVSRPASRLRWAAFTTSWAELAPPKNTWASRNTGKPKAASAEVVDSTSRVQAPRARLSNRICKASTKHRGGSTTDGTAKPTATQAPGEASVTSSICTSSGRHSPDAHSTAVAAALRRTCNAARPRRIGADCQSTSSGASNNCRCASAKPIQPATTGPGARAWPNRYASGSPPLSSSDGMWRCCSSIAPSIQCIAASTTGGAKRPISAARPSVRKPLANAWRSARSRPIAVLHLGSCSVAATVGEAQEDRLQRVLAPLRA